MEENQWAPRLGRPYGLVENGNFLYATNIIDVPGVGIHIRKIDKTDASYRDVEIVVGNPGGNNAFNYDRFSCYSYK